MDTNNQINWSPGQAAIPSSLDAVLASDPADTVFCGLPPIIEQDWDLEWENDLFTQTYAPACLERTSNTVNAPSPSEDTSAHVLKELANLQEQIKSLRQDNTELQSIISQRLDGMDKRVKIAERYVKHLIPWSMEVYEKCSKLLEVAKGLTGGIADGN
ncbi:hypothetical protein CC86DRAFT_473016 [Ophiobolus disseminans]|uniref:Uncharacterized protein n=1 Tax=Ophiobolus disseminans TaxID=1469910 RepID=A0A6A6ZCS6_9PLEO|nr:hypothetical protein CC86DRAFT_473016 [Ophiobolus disseminans]